LTSPAAGEIVAPAAMLRDRIMALLGHIPVVGPKEEEFDPFADVEAETEADFEADDSVHAQGGDA
jgi:hypothetical protein